MGWVWLIVAAVLLIFWGTPIWIAARAEPLAGVSYRWGTFIAVMMCCIGVIVALIPYQVKALTTFNVTLTLAVALPMLIGGIGLIRRRKWGVVVFFVAWFLLGSMNPILDSYNGTDTSGKYQAGGGMVWLIMILSAFYFKKRWKFMAWR